MKRQELKPSRESRTWRDAARLVGEGGKVCTRLPNAVMVMATVVGLLTLTLTYLHSPNTYYLSGFVFLFCTQFKHISCLRFLYTTINQTTTMSGSSTPKSANGTRIPITRTVAIIKCHALDHRMTIERRIEDEKFEVSAPFLVIAISPSACLT